MDREQLEAKIHADKIMTAGKLTGAFAHELNNAMTGILIFSESLTQSVEDESIKEQLHDILQGAHRCKDLIGGMLRFVRKPRESSPSMISLEKILDQVQLLVRHQAALSRIKLKVTIEPSLNAIQAKEVDVEHALVALLCEALEATPVGQEIGFTVSNNETQQQVELEVCVSTAVFADEKDAPPKIGRQDMAIVREILHQMGASYSRQVDPGGDCRVRLSFPYAREEENGA